VDVPGARHGSTELAEVKLTEAPSVLVAVFRHDIHDIDIRVPGVSKIDLRAGVGNSGPFIAHILLRGK
jgi:hypothetical protein